MSEKMVEILKCSGNECDKHQGLCCKSCEDMCLCPYPCEECEEECK